MESRVAWRSRALRRLIGIGVLSLLPELGSAEAVTLAWDPNPEPDLAGYRVHLGITPGTYTKSIDVGHVTTFTLPDLSAGRTYYLAVSAYDIFANESGFSSEITTTIPMEPSPAETSPPSSGDGGTTGGTTTPPPDSTSRSTTADQLYQKGQQLYEQGQYQDAIRAYRHAQRRYRELRNPEQRAAVLEDMGRALEAQGNFEAAAARYERARRIRERLANQ